MNRYKSSQRWRKVEAGCYESPDGRFFARKAGKSWTLCAYGPPGGYVRDRFGPFVTLADCQEHAERLERGDASV